jgi:hypothetical protein
MDRSAPSDIGEPALALDARRTRAAIVRELRLVEGAIALVATGSAPRVTVGGLAFGAQVLARLGATARRQRVTMLERWSPWSDSSQVEVRLDD